MEPAENALAQRADFVHLLAQHFNETEIRSLCFEMAVDDEELRGSTKSEIIISLIRHLEQRERIADLLRLCRQHRPMVNWPSALKPSALSPLPSVLPPNKDESIYITIERGARTGYVVGRVENWTQIIKQPALWHAPSVSIFQRM